MPRTTHGMSKSRPYHIRSAMIQRCHKENYKFFYQYGGKGISVCKEWRESFENFWEWASNNGYEDNLTIDRIDPNGNYEPSNCQWISQHQQVLKQKRNKNRNAQDKYIRELKNGKWNLCISKYINGKNTNIFTRVCKTKEDAIDQRDYFLKNGKGRVKEKRYTKKSSLLPSTKNGLTLFKILMNKNISIKDLGESLQISRQAVHNWIYKYGIPKSKINLIANSLSVSPSVFKVEAK